MNDLISRSALLEELQKGTIIPDDMYSEGIMAGVDSAIKKLEAAPAVDAVGVVRCKDCERRDKTADLTNDILCPYMEAIMPKNAFCSYGERRSDDATD